MNVPRTSLQRWATEPSLAADRLPRVEAEFLLAVLECDAAERETVSFATRRFADACPDTETAVAHLLSLRNLFGPSPIGRAVDEQIVALVSRELVEARRTAHADPLTGLGNRRALDEVLPGAVARAERTAKGLAVIFFDLIGLKAVNDGIGHHAGDETLRSFAIALTSSARASDLAYRVGGDEFVVLMPDTNPDEVLALVDRIVQSGAPPFSWGSTNTITEGFDAARLVRVADLRMLSSRYRPSLERRQAAESGARDDTEIDLRQEQSTARRDMP